MVLEPGANEVCRSHPLDSFGSNSVDRYRDCRRDLGSMCSEKLLLWMYGDMVNVTELIRSLTPNELCSVRTAPSIRNCIYSSNEKKLAC